MLRRAFVIGTCMVLAGCVVQPNVTSRPMYPYPPAWYPRPYPPLVPASHTSPEPYPRAPNQPRPYPAPGERPAAGGVAPGYADEAADYGIEPTSNLRLDDFDAPTPMRIEGARTIDTMTLRAMLASSQPPVLVDVIGGRQAVSLPGAVWLRDAGVGRHIDDDVQAWFDFQLSKLTGGDKSRPLVIFCASRMCWLAHNATLRALDLGYTSVHWYRGGRDSWQAAGLPLEPVAPPPS